MALVDGMGSGRRHVQPTDGEWRGRGDLGVRRCHGRPGFDRGGLGGTGLGGEWRRALGRSHPIRDGSFDQLERLACVCDDRYDEGLLHVHNHTADRLHGELQRRVGPGPHQRQRTERRS